MSDRFNEPSRVGGGHSRGGGDNRDSGGYRGRGGFNHNDRGGGANNMPRHSNYQSNQRGPPQDEMRGGGGPNMSRQMSQPIQQRAIGQPVNINTSLDGFYTALMREEMPQHFISIFRARKMPEYYPPVEGLVKKNYRVKGYQTLIDEYSEIFNKFEEEDSPANAVELKSAAKLRIKKANLLQNIIDQKEKINNYNPDNDKKIRGDPYKTIFVGRLNFKTDEKRIMDSFEQYGKIRKVTLVRNIHTDKSKGYGFIEFYEEKHAQIAYQRGDRKKIDGHYVLVDKEQARIDKKWLPRRLGGGRGGETRKAGQEEKDLIRDIKKQFQKDKKDKQEQEKLEKQNVHMSGGDKDPYENDLKRQKIEQPETQQPTSRFSSQKQHFVKEDAPYKKKNIEIPENDEIEDGEL